MSGLIGIFLTVQSVVFPIWVFLMFRALFGITRRHNAATGKPFVGPIAVFSVYGAYLKDPTYRGERRLILLFTGILLVLIILFATVPRT